MLRNKKVRYKVMILTTFALLLLLTYLISFPLFEPGYLEMKNVEIVTNSWNLDKDIKTIENYYIELKGHKLKANFNYDKKD